MKLLPTFGFVSFFQSRRTYASSISQKINRMSCWTINFGEKSSRKFAFKVISPSGTQPENFFCMELNMIRAFSYFHGVCLSSLFFYAWYLAKLFLLFLKKSSHFWSGVISRSISPTIFSIKLGEVRRHKVNGLFKIVTESYLESIKLLQSIDAGASQKIVRNFVFPIFPTNLPKS